VTALAKIFYALAQPKSQLFNTYKFESGGGASNEQEEQSWINEKQFDVQLYVAQCLELGGGGSCS
jgi:hypothetical protein